MRRKSKKKNQLVNKQTGYRMQNDNKMHSELASKKKKEKDPFWATLSPHLSWINPSVYQTPQKPCVTDNDNSSNNSATTNSATMEGSNNSVQTTDSQGKTVQQTSLPQHTKWMQMKRINPKQKMFRGPPRNVNNEENFARDDFELSNREDFEKGDILQESVQNASKAKNSNELNKKDNTCTMSEPLELSGDNTPSDVKDDTTKAEATDQVMNTQNRIVTGVPSEIKITLKKDTKTLTAVNKPNIETNVKDIKENNDSSYGVSNTNVIKPVGKPIQMITLTNTAKPNRNNQRAAAGYPRGFAGIPKTFLMQQQRFGAIEPQTSFEPPSTQNTPLYFPPQNVLHAPVLNLTSLQQAAAPTQNEYAMGLAPNTPTFVTTDLPNINSSDAYSPSDIYADSTEVKDHHEGSESPDLCQRGQKRLSAFQRLGPLTQPKTPKLTINLMFNKEKAVREVVDETDKESEDKYTPVHLRPDVQTSTDDIVMKYLIFWPWKKTVNIKKSVTVRTSKSVMMMEQEQMEEIYIKDNTFIQVSVKGYPRSWSKEDVLDTLLENLKGKAFVPCFIELTPQECKFLVIRNRAALIAIHKMGFIIRKGAVELVITISQTDLTLNNVEFIPKLVLKRRLMHVFNENSLDLSGFTLENDVSHFIYYPLNRETNQIDLCQLQSSFIWENLTELNLSNNRLTSLDGFDLLTIVPRLKRLDISNNRIERIKTLLKFRNLPLRSISLDGNPVCHDYTDPSLYTKVLKMIFPMLTEIDGIELQMKGGMPTYKKNYCPYDAMGVVERFLEVFFPLLDSSPEDRCDLQEMYADDAMLTITYRDKLRNAPIYRYFRNLFLRCRVLHTVEMDMLQGPAAIAKHMSKWPPMVHDPYTFTVDVLYHDDATTIFRIGGILKLTAETLADDEHLLAFNRTVVINTSDGCEYKIRNELVTWDKPLEKYANTAFQITTVRSKQLSVKTELNPDDYLKEKLINIFMELTGLEKKLTERCLEKKNWSLSSAIEHFMELLKLDCLDSLRSESEKCS